jgi:peptidoglycan hydrolase-like protein with peptidoglycan-binding domain
VANLQVGSSGQDVLYLQNNLWALGFGLSTDGIFGPETQQAVKNFQYTWGIPVDGIFGPQTSAALEEAINLLNQGQWDPSADPMKYAPSAPSRVGAPVALSSPVAAAAYPGGAVYQTPSGQQIVAAPKTGLAGLDWKWIGLGIAGIALLFYLSKQKEEEE